MKKAHNDIRILIIGDSCEDKFIYGDVSRLAPEGPAPIFNPEYSKSNGGMALNVKANIEAIGAKATLITQPENIIKTRYVDERTNSLLLRVDEESKLTRIKSDIVESIVDNIYNDTLYDALIISDYCKGFLEESDIKKISSRNSNVFLDTKKILGNWCTECDYIKINQTEFNRTKHTIDKLNILEKLIITRSDEGCEYKNIIHSVEKVNIKDLSGAGDTFISGLVCEFCNTNDIVRAIKFAQDCATIVVQKKGVCTI
jgi:D-beta-D-heptose 7-phosphate kinase/D-beta-D-heptose 1-phosphate adenosyltransferase